MRLFILPLCLCVSFGLAGCAGSQRIMTEPATTAAPVIQLKQDYAVTRLNPGQLDQPAFDEIARHYHRTGTGPVYAVIAYNPDAKPGKTAGMERAVKAALKKSGLRQAKIVSLASNTAHPFVLVGYDALIASAPEECADQSMPGHQSATAMDDHYRLGCTVTDMMARQIADPRDLRGRSGLGSSADGERAANQVATYRGGETLEFLPSYFISELSAQ